MSNKLPVDLKCNDLAKILGQQWKSMPENEKDLYRKLSEYMRNSPL